MRPPASPGFLTESVIEVDHASPADFFRVDEIVHAGVDLVARQLVMELRSGIELTTLAFDSHLLTKLISTALVAAGRLQSAGTDPAQAIIPEHMGVAVFEGQIVMNFDIADGLPLNFILSQQDARTIANSILASLAI